jgi:hypothetical protein
MIEAPALVLLAWLLGNRNGRTSPPKRNGNGNRGGIAPAGEVYDEGVFPRAVPKGGEVPIKQTGGADIRAWRKTRFDACIDFLMNDDRALNAITTLFDHHVIERGDIEMDSVALSVVTHWDIETASGSHEFNFNLGGIGAVPGEQHFISTDVGDPTKRVAFCAYDSLQEGIADYFGVLSYERYVSALAPLLMLPVDPTWFSELGWDGWYQLKDAGHPNALDAVEAEQAWAARRLLVATDAGVAPNL